ncbi:MAG: hypothetical protein JWO65_231 [Sphingomonas bacterium]|jgi:hypothetical protein|nr:hypothetical protein [Sphingomonas bacterium]
MNDRITKLSLGAIWDETAKFVRAEFALLLPVAFLGFGLPLLIAMMAMPVEAAKTGTLAPGPWMLWMLPGLPLAMIGFVAVSALALRPGATVRDCLGVAIARLPAAFGLFGLYMAMQVLLALPLAAISLIERQLTGAIGPVSMVGNLASLAITIWVFVRLLPVWAVLSDRSIGPWGAVKAAFAMTRGHYVKLLLLSVVGPCAALLLFLVVLVPLGAITAMIAMLSGAQRVSEILSFVGTAAVFAMLAAIWTVYVARLSVWLSGSISGT